MAWTRAIGVGIRAVLAHRIRRLSDQRRWADGAGEIQRSQLRSLLSRAKGTEFGRAHGFADLLRAGDADLERAHRERIPVQSYTDLKPMLERMRRDAEPDVSWPGVVRDWAQTSGTTAGDKYVPVSKELFRHNSKAALDVYAHAVRFGCSLPDIFAGKALFLGGSSDVSVSERGVRTGDLSGLVTRLIRWPISAVWLPGKEIALMSDWSEKIDAMARRCLNEDVRWLSGMPSWSIALFDRMVEVAREQGREASRLRDLWPNLRIFVHGGVKYDPFERRIREMWSGDPEGDDIPTRLEVYAASEAFVAAQDAPGDPGMRLNIDHGVHYEFVPFSEIDDDSPRAFACDEVERGERYVVVMSTCGGLWRYNIGDLVEFDTIPPDGPPRLRIVGRARHFMNAFGENIIAEHIENAAAAAARATGAGIGEFTAAPRYPDANANASIELALEWNAPADRALLERFRDAFDEALKRQNNDYTGKRTGDVGMAPPVVTPLPMGTFHRWLESRGKLGGQHKCPRCANDRAVIEEILALASEHVEV